MSFKIAVVFMAGMLLGSLAPSLIFATYNDDIALPREIWGRMCARMDNWTLAQFSHEWWAEHGGYGPSSVAWELAWGQIYYEQIKDLRVMGC